MKKSSEHAVNAKTDIVSVETPLHAVRLRLSYADCDPAGIVYYATWFPWMEKAHTEYCLLRGLRFDTLLASYGAVPVTRHTECEYLVTTRLFDEIRCGMRPDHVGRTSYRMAFTFVREDDHAVVARSSLTLVCVTAQGTPAPIPGALRAILNGRQPPSPRP